MSRRLPDAATIRAAWWAVWTLRAVRRLLAEGRVTETSRIEGPALPVTAVRGVEAVLHRRHHSCLEGALVRQRWLAAHGVHRDVVIGVLAPAQGFAAHAWLDGAERAATGPLFHELARLSP